MHEQPTNCDVQWLTTSTCTPVDSSSPERTASDRHASVHTRDGLSLTKEHLEPSLLGRPAPRAPCPPRATFAQSEGWQDGSDLEIETVSPQYLYILELLAQH
jgi:hypothetical protein